MAGRSAILSVKILADARKATAGVDQAGRSFDNLGRKAAGLALKVGGAIGAVKLVKTVLTKGWARLTSIENAQAKLTGLGNSAGSVQTIMDDALKSVKGTAFGLDEAAGVAASAVAAGVKPGKDLQRTLSLVGDAATIGGASMAEMGAVFNKVASANKLQGDQINQLNDRGIPIVQMLGKVMGKSSAEVTKLASKGKIDFATFQKAMQAGLGGAALKSGNTTQGAWKNVQAASGRLGAALLRGLFPQAKTVFSGMTGLLDRLTDKAGPAADRLSARLIGGIGRIRDQAGPILTRLADQARTALDKIKLSPVTANSIDRLRSIWDKLRATIAGLTGPVASILQSLAKASTAIGVSSWQLLLAVLDSLAGAIKATLVPALSWVAKFMQQNPAAVMVLVGAFTAYKTITTVITTATRIWTAAQAVLNGVLRANPVGLVITAVALLAAGIVTLWRNSETFRRIVLAVWSAVRTAAIVAWNGIRATIGGVWSFVTGASQTAQRIVGGVWTGIRTAAQTAWNGIRAIVAGVVGAIGGIVGGVASTVSAAWGGMVAIVTGIWDRIRLAIATVVGWIKDIIRGVTNVWNAVSGGVTGGINWVADRVDWLQRKINSLTSPSLIDPGRFLSSGGLFGSAGLTAAAGGLSGPQATGGAGGIVVNVYGALDPDAVARQIESLLSRRARRNGSIAIGGRAA